MNKTAKQNAKPLNRHICLRFLNRRFQQLRSVIIVPQVRIIVLLPLLVQPLCWVFILRQAMEAKHETGFLCNLQEFRNRFSPLENSGFVELLRAGHGWQLPGGYFQWNTDDIRPFVDVEQYANRCNRSDPDWYGRCQSTLQCNHLRSL